MHNKTHALMLFPAAVWQLINEGYWGDGDKQILYNVDGVDYYQFDNIIRSRDDTYDVLGRFHKKYFK